MEVYVSSKGNTFLDFGRPHPNQVFAAVVFASSAPRFGDLKRYQNKAIQLTGQIKLYKGKPEMILDRPDQLHLVP